MSDTEARDISHPDTVDPGAPLDINPADAVVYAPTLPRTYDTVRGGWRAAAPLTVSLLFHAPYYLDTLEPGQFRATAMPGGVGGASPEAAGGPPRGQVTRLSQHEFGLSSGLDRLMSAAEREGLPFAVALDAYGVTRVPRLASGVAARAGEIVVRGQAATSIISSAMSESDEVDYIRTSRAAVERATGRTADGWFGPERGLTERTTALLRREGFRWFGDWPVDERPVELDGDATGLTALPFSLATEDSHQLYGRGLRFGDFETLLDETLTQLIADAEFVGPRFLGLSWFGWVLGQACYIGVAERILARLAADPRIAVVLPSATLGVEDSTSTTPTATPTPSTPAATPTPTQGATP
jgi:allantoinase